MHQQFLDAGIAVAGIDVGEAYGSPHAFPHFEALYQEMVKQGYSKKPALLGRSRGGLWVSSWALEHPDRVAGIGGIYPVYDYNTYPGRQASCPCLRYQRSRSARATGPAESDQSRRRVGRREDSQCSSFTASMTRSSRLAANSAALEKVYESKGAAELIEVIQVEGQGHNFWPGFFHCQELVDFLVQKAQQRRVG